MDTGQYATVVAVTRADDAAHQLLLLFGGESTDPVMYHGSVFEARLFFPDSPQRAEKPGTRAALGHQESKGINIEEFAQTNLE